MRRIQSCHFVVLFVMLLGLTPFTHAQLPDGFEQDAIVEGLIRPTSFAFLPDGRVLVAEQLGDVKVVAQGQVETIYTFTGLTITFESGLLAVEVDPNFTTNRYVYFYFTRSNFNSLVRFTVIGDLSDSASPSLALTDEYVIIDDIPTPIGTHNGGGLRFSSDGHLFLSIGDGGNPCAAQDVTSMLGKVLCLDISALPASGSNPPTKSDLAFVGNPFYPSGNDITDLVYAMGLRNPYRLQVDSTGVFIAEVGQSDWEEINFAVGGENFAWPWLQGPSPFVGCSSTIPSLEDFTPAAVLEAHPPSAFSFNIVLTPGLYRSVPGRPFDFGLEYDGSLFTTRLTEFVFPTPDTIGPDPMARRVFDGGMWVHAPVVPGQLAPTAWGATDAPTESRVGPDGAIWYTDFFAGVVKRIRPVAGSRNLDIISGQGQSGNASYDLVEPLLVRLSDQNGQSVVGEPVWFGVQAGGGTFSSSVVMTDSEGLASASYTVNETRTGVDPILAAGNELSNPVHFDVDWRGLELLSEDDEVTFVVHSDPNSPVALIADVGTVTSPYLAFPFGCLWVGVAGTTMSEFISLCNEALNPANPECLTGPDGAVTLNFTVPPTFPSTDFTFQALGISESLPFPASIFLSNRIYWTSP